MKATILALGLAAVLTAVVGLSLTLSPNAGGGGKVQAQGASPAAPANVRAANGTEAGQAVVRWDAVAEATYYRIGWVSMDEYRAVQAEEGRQWLDVFDFRDVVNRGQTVQTISNLEPGVQYAFIMASVGQRFGNAAGWSQWDYLTTAEAEAPSCPADAGTTPDDPVSDGTPTPTPAPGATPAATPTPAPTPTPVGRDYDTDNDGLIEITSLAQLDVIRHDLDGDGVSTHADHAAAFPDAARGMGCRHYECAGYELDADLDFDTNGNGEADEGDAYWDDGAGWLPIGDPETQFRYNAVFDGNGHTISNLFIRWREANYIGLFRATGADADIRNVQLAGVEVSGRNWVGGLVGSNGGSISGSSAAGRVSGVGGIGGLVGYNSGSVSGSYSSVPVAGSGARVGGLVGSSAGNVSDSYATGAVTSEGSSVGGLVGVTGSDASISDSYATGNVNGEGNWVGGLVGSSNGAITGSHATGDVTGEGYHVGGLVGSSSSTTIASYATGDVTGRDNVGGLVGREYNSGSITASYATGSVTGNDSVGGLLGYVWAAYRYDGPVAKVTASYATGSVTGSSGVGGLVGRVDGASGYTRTRNITASYATGNVTGSSDVGGLVGSRGKWGQVSVTISYWDTQTTGQSRSYGGTGKTTRELQSPTGHTGIYANWNADWWDFGTSRQYPALKYQGMDVAAQRR